MDALVEQNTKNRGSMIMIAHKLETAVRYSDKILVMDQGSVAEFDSAKNLLELDADNTIHSSGIFASMVAALNEQ